MSRFSEQAELYAKYRPDYPDAMYDFIFQHLSSRRCAWDCATGSGQIASYLSNYFEKVVATDISQRQLDLAPRKANIEYRKVSAEDSGLPDNHFDLITVGQAIHWFDFERFYQEAQRVANDKALLAVIGYGMVRVSNEINPIIEDLYEEAFGTYFDENRRYIDEKYRTIPFPFEEIPSPSFENTFNWSLDELEGFFNTWSAIQEMKSKQGYNPADKIIKRIREKVGSNQNIEATFPVFMRLGTIQK